MKRVRAKNVRAHMVVVAAAAVVADARSLTIAGKPVERNITTACAEFRMVRINEQNPFRNCAHPVSRSSLFSALCVVRIL